MAGLAEEAMGWVMAGWTSSGWTVPGWAVSWRRGGVVMRWQGGVAVRLRSDAVMRSGAVARRCGGWLVGVVLVGGWLVGLVVGALGLQRG